MANWSYVLKANGIKLRDLIHSDDSSQENCIEILEQMIVCCKELLTKISDEDKDWYEYDLEEMIDDCEDTKSYLDEFDEESNEDNINGMLAQFYDLMNTMRVWVAL